MRAPLLIVSLLCGCATPSRDVLFEGDDYLIVAGKADDSYAQVAEDVLQEPAYAEQIARANVGIELNADSAIFVPRKPRNTRGVYADGVQQIPILCYHQFHVSVEHSRGLVVSAQQFEAQMAYLHQNDYRVVTLGEVAAFVAGDGVAPAKSVAITVDDGYESFLEVAYPVLKKYGYPATVFIYPEFVGGGKALDWSQIKRLDADPLIGIESHSKTHDSLWPRPGGEDPDRYQARIRREVEDTDRIFSRQLGRRASRFSYPYGNASDKVVELLAARDYDLALTVAKGGNPSYSHPLLMRRTMVYGEDNLKRFISYLDVFETMDLR